LKIEREQALLEMKGVHDYYYYTNSHGYTKRGRSHVIKTDDKKLDSGNTEGHVPTFRVDNILHFIPEPIQKKATLIIYMFKTT
jgi:hypothetical protein